MQALQAGRDVLKEERTQEMTSDLTEEEGTLEEGQGQDQGDLKIWDSAEIFV